MIVPAAGQGLTFQGLPNEILLSIADWLDDVSAVCLKNTNSFFRSIIHREPGSFSLCSKWLIMCRFETDLLLQFSGCTTLPKNFPEELVCGFCKVKRPVHQIGGRRVGSKNMGFPVYTNTRPLIPSSIDRYCVRHPLSISWVKPDERSSGPHIEKRWAMSSQLTCMHCAAHVDDRDTRVTGCDRCHCDVCPRGTDNLFTRYGPLSWFAWGDRPHIISLEYFGNGICYVNENGGELIRTDPSDAPLINAP